MKRYDSSTSVRDLGSMVESEYGEYFKRQEVIGALAAYGREYPVDDPDALCSAFGVTLDEYLEAGGQ